MRNSTKGVLLPALIFYAASSNVIADSVVFKCTYPSGHVVFSDAPKPDSNCRALDLPGYVDPLGSANPRGTMRIVRGPDGHFEINGKVNGVPVTFLVDTGASSVSITNQVANIGNLPAGRPVISQTANGLQMYRVVDNVEVSIGSLDPVRTKVMTGLVEADPQEALLGQSFLRHYDIQISGNYMTLTRRPTKTRTAR